MRNFVMAAVVLSLAVSCSSASNSRSTTATDATQINVAKPEIEIVQLSAMPAAARHVTGGVPIQYAMRVGNRAGETLTLKSVSLVSVGSGAYDVSASSSFKQSILPDQEETVKFWVPAHITNPTIMGANGPVTIRATVYFETPRGSFQEIIVQQVNAMPGRDSHQ